MESLGNPAQNEAACVLLCYRHVAFLVRFPREKADVFLVTKGSCVNSKHIF
jgi:hypothetical protein